MYRFLRRVSFFGFFLLISLGDCLSSSNPRYAKLVQCRDNRSKWVPQRGNSAGADLLMAGCLKEILMAVGPKYRSGKGIPELGIDPEDPFVIPFTPMDIPELKMKGNATNVRIVGMATSLTEQNTDVIINSAVTRGEVRFRIPRMQTIGDFEATVDFLGAFFPGAAVGNDGAILRGTLDATLENVDATLFLILGRSSDPREGMKVTNVGMKWSYAGVSLTMAPKFTGRETAAEKRQQEALFSLTTAASGNEDLRRLMVKEFEPLIINFVTRAKFRVLSKGLDNIDLL